MTKLLKMPIVTVDQAELARFGEMWLNNGGRLSRLLPQSSTQLGRLFDAAVAASLSTMLGGIPVVQQEPARMKEPTDDCVEIGAVSISGGITPQTFDVGYRPDGVRFAFDSKTLNDRDSVRKNWQNMITDLLAEATNVHSQYKSAIMAFMVIIPSPCFIEPQRSGILRRLERLAGRARVEDPDYMAEAISLVIWNPKDGQIEGDVPARESPLRLERFAQQVEAIYTSRYIDAAVIHKDETSHQLDEIGQRRQLKVFICHSSGDKPAVRDLYNRLRSAADYISPWLDEEDLLPGQRWEDEIPKAVRRSDIVIVCLSKDSVNKRGYVQKEIKYALDVADEHPEDAIFLIPVRLEDCEVPERLKHLHYVNLHDIRGFERLLRTLQVCAEKLGIVEATGRAAEKAKSLPNITQLIGRTPDEVERVAGGTQARTEITNDSSQMPGEFREYEVRNSRLGLTVYGMMVRYHHERAVHITVDLPDQYASAEEALLAVGVDVRGTKPRVVAPVATRWTGKFSGVEFKDVAAVKTDPNLQAFSTVQITLAE